MSDELSLDRKRRTITYKRSVFIVVVGLSIYLIWSLKPLILPVIFGLLLAYICLPLTIKMQRKGIPKILSVVILLVLFFTFLFYAVVFIKGQLPDRYEQVRLKVVALYQLNERYTDFMKLNTDPPGNSLVYRLIGFETDPFMDSINQYLVLSPDEQELFVEAYPYPTEIDSSYARLWKMHEQNERLLLYSTQGYLYDSVVEKEDSPTPVNRDRPSNISLIMNVFSTWMVMPIIFFFFLFDDGQFRRNIIRLVPNMYFEMALTSLRNVDRAIGMYLRGTILETVAVFISFLILLPVIGFNLTATILIGLAAAILNIIPIIGALAGIVLCMVYALIIEDVNSILPFINQTNLVFFAAITGSLVQLLDNTIFKPYILGNAIELHPLVVVIAVIGGAIMFDFWGILFSVPLIVILKVTVLNIMKQLKQYQIVER